MERGGRIAEGLPRVGERFIVHVFVERDMSHEIREVGLHRIRPEVIQNAFEDAIHVLEGVGAGGEGEVPPGVVGNAHRVVERVPILPGRSLAQMPTQDPVLLEPGDMTDLPEQRIEDGEAGSQEAIPLEIRHQVQGAGARIQQVPAEFGGGESA
jgi:hypothetical protein